MIRLLHETVLDSIKMTQSKYFPTPTITENDFEHLNSVINWLDLAYKNGNGGVSSHYSLLSNKWLAPFPETTGYIIPTLYQFSNKFNQPIYAKIAQELADWLTAVQLENGACIQGAFIPEKRKISKPIIFNTGQNIFGFLESFHQTNNEKYLNSANKAGDFLVRSTNTNGIWNKHLHNNIPHTYNSRSSWALLKLFLVTKNNEYENIAIKNLDWVILQQKENGWFENANFKSSEYPNTHGLAYTARGLLESYLITGNTQYLLSCQKIADKFLRMYEISKKLRTFWDHNWKNHDKYFSKFKGNYYCLTGNLQWSIIWMKMYDITDRYEYANTAFKMIDFIKSLQNINSNNPNIRGGIKGSFPIYGKYSFGKYPNWAAKFFADALMLKINIMDKINNNLKK